jgi:tetratricopeptide (TPR) repeat protein
MMKSYFYLIIILALILIGCSPNEQSKVSLDTDEIVLGELQHGFKLNQLTQEKFDEGLLLLHNFEYDDALVAFEKATANDSTEILTHWGEAMCHYKALWKLQNTDKGRVILSRIGNTKEERLASISDPIEKVLWEIVEIMYGEGEFEDRNKMIKEHLSSSHKKYPNHQEIAAFYALSLIWSTEAYGDGSDDLRLAASITDKITKVNPLHPGALHYKIHALDGPTSAKEALDAADIYAKVATDAAHALHMPSHIYLAIGNWNDVVNSNQESYDASVDRMTNLNLQDGARGYHSFAWLHYGLLQQGKYTKAEQILNDMLTYVPKDPTKGARGYLVGMQSRQLAESGNVSEETLLDIDVKVDDIGLMAQSARSFLRAQIAFQNEDTNTMKEEINWLSNKIFTSSLQIEEGGIPMCAAGTSRYAPTKNSIKSAKVIKSQIQGMKALIEGNEELFEVHMKKAVELEEQTDFPAGPPRITKPAFEQYGEWLLEQGDYAEANKQFDKALLRMPRRSKSLIGKMTAHKALNQNKKLEKVVNELQSILAQADLEVRNLLHD